MSRFLVAVLGALLVVAVGCQEDDKKHGDRHRDDAMKASKDVCPHCPGVQKANAKGECPVCSAKSSGAGAAAQPAGADVCTHCPGVQTANAEGKCPACGMEVAKKQ